MNPDRSSVVDSTDAEAAPTPPTTVPVRRDVRRAPEPVPPEVRDELEPQFGESLADVRVHRGPDVGVAARSMSAKAFATGGEVFLPDEHGPVRTGEGRKILAHELTHVVQQRRLGSDLPDEGSAAGAALEREALEVGGQAPPVPARKLPAADATSTRGAQRLTSPTLPPRPSRPVHAASTDLDPAGQAAVVARIQAAASDAGIPAKAPATDRSDQVTVPQRLAASGLSAAAPAGMSSTATAQQASTPLASSSSSAVVAAAASSASNERSPDDLDTLAGQLYPRMRTRLRSELLTDRERSGRLFDR